MQTIYFLKAYKPLSTDHLVTTWFHLVALVAHIALVAHMALVAPMMALVTLMNLVAFMA